MTSSTPYRCLHGAAVVAILTGIGYGWTRCLVHSADEFAIVNHPWQPHLQHAHILVTPLLVLMLGTFWWAHAAAHWRSGAVAGRRSGLSLWLTALPMILSGYLLQISVSDFWRQAWILVHVATSLAWTGAYLAHLLTHRRPAPANPFPPD